MDSIRQERLSQASIMNLNKRFKDTKFMKQEIWHTHQGIYGL